MPKNDSNNDKARLRRLVACIIQGADMATELAYRLDDGEEGEGNEYQRRASNIHAHLIGSVMEWEEGGLAEPGEQSGAHKQEPRQGLGAVNGSASLNREPQTHALKTWPAFYEAVVGGWKPFEARKADRDFAVGDTLRLEEWCPDEGYTGRVCFLRVTYILRGPAFGIEAGWVVLGLATPNRVINKPS